MLATPTFNHGLWGVDLYDKGKGTVYLCEGLWDACALWECLYRAKEVDAELVPVANPDDSVLADANVLAVPGCSVFMEGWSKLFAGKIVNLLYDNDHPRKQGKKRVKGAGLQGMQRAASILSNATKPPAEINYLRWSTEGHDSNLPDGYDVRDCITA